MSFIRTILADIPPSELGVCYAHEHIIIDRCFATNQEPGFLLEDVDRAVQELKRFHDAGGRAMIDTMPGEAGRNAAKLAQVSERSGVHIVSPTGMHLAKYYPPGHRWLSLDERELAELFIDEIVTGIVDDAKPVSAPRRAGVIKVASGFGALSSHERKVFNAAAAAHRATGCPIITHTEAGTAAMEQIDLFADSGVDLSRVTLSHTDRLPDVQLHRKLLNRGVNLEYDSCFRWRPADGNPTLKLIAGLASEFGSQLMLGMDAARRAYWISYGGAPGMNFLLNAFTPSMRSSGISDAQIRRIFVENPAMAFSFTATI